MDILHPIRHHLQMISTNLGLYSAQEQGRMLRHYLGICMHMCMHVLLHTLVYFEYLILLSFIYILTSVHLLEAKHTVLASDKQHPVWTFGQQVLSSVAV